MTEASASGRLWITSQHQPKGEEGKDMIYQNEDMRCDCNVCDLLQRCQYRYIKQRLPVRRRELEMET